MTIYLVTSGEYSGYGIEAAFLDRHKAEIYIATRRSQGYYEEYWLEEWETSDDRIKGDVDTIWEYHFYTGDIDIYTAHCIVKNEVGIYNNRIEIEKGRPAAYVYMKNNDNAKAKKIARDMYAKYKAEKEGIV